MHPGKSIIQKIATKQTNPRSILQVKKQNIISTLEATCLCLLLSDNPIPRALPAHLVRPQPKEGS